MNYVREIQELIKLSFYTRIHTSIVALGKKNTFVSFWKEKYILPYEYFPINLPKIYHYYYNIEFRKYATLMCFQEHYKR